jgi:hypothetical protein
MLLPVKRLRGKGLFKIDLYKYIRNVVNKKDKKDDYQKTQAASAPGKLGEEVNRNKQHTDMTEAEKSIHKTAQQEGLNEEKSQGDAVAFEGLDNTGK